MHLGKGLLAVWMVAFCQALCAAQTSPDECYQRAANRYRTADWSGAAAALRDFVSRYPDDPRALDARFYLGEAHLQASQLAQARASYRAFVDQLGGKPHDDEAIARFRIGEASFLLHDQAEAAAVLGDFCGRYPDHPLVTYALPYLAELALVRGDFEDGLRLADRVLRMGGERTYEANLIIARCYHAMGQFAAARAACFEIERDGRAEFEILAKARLIVAQSHAQQSQWEAAIRAYHRLAMLPSLQHQTSASGYRAEALLAAADCYRQLGEVQLAKQTYTTVLLEFPRTESSEQATQQLANLVGSTAT
jgi:TolA-binding protein